MRIDLARHLKTFVSSLFLQSSWSFFSMQSMGFLHALLSGAKKEQHERIMKEQKVFFNTHPYMASYVIGATLRIYDDGIKYPDEIKRFLAVAQTSFASAGDLLFWHTIRPALLMLSIILAFKTGPAGMLAFLIIYNVFHVYHRFWGIASGFTNGFNVIYLLKTARFIQVQRVFEIIGAFVTGMLITLIKPNILGIGIVVVPLTLFFLALVMRRFPAIIVILILLAMIIFLSLI